MRLFLLTHVLVINFSILADSLHRWMSPFWRAETLSMDVRSNCSAGISDFIAYVRLPMSTSFMQQFRPLMFVEMMSCTGQDMKTVMEETLRWMLVRNVLWHIYIPTHPALQKSMKRNDLSLEKVQTYPPCYK